MAMTNYTDEDLKRIWKEAQEHAAKLERNMKYGYCEVCGSPATMHERHHHYCLRHWQERACEEV